MAHPDRSVSEHNTTTTTTTSGGAGMGIIVGALVVIVGILAYFMFGGEAPSGSNDVTVTIEGAGDAVQGAAEAVEGAAEGAATTASD